MINLFSPVNPDIKLLNCEAVHVGSIVFEVVPVGVLKLIVTALGVIVGIKISKTSLKIKFGWSFIETVLKA